MGRIVYLLLVIASTAWGMRSVSEEDMLDRVREYHGGAGPWVVAGYRIGEAALQRLGLPRYSFSLDVAHMAPKAYQFSCMVDGIQAATGASLGKLNLRYEIVDKGKLRTLFVDKAAKRKLSFYLKPGFIERFEGEVDLEMAAKEVAHLNDDAIFELLEELPSALFVAPSVMTYPAI